MVYFLLLLLGICNNAIADTMEHYMNIANQIPKMELKANPQAQSWARSARTVLELTNETLSETMNQANELARAKGHPLFCLSAGQQLNSNTLNTLITRTYNNISSQPSDKAKMTVSQLAWLAVTETYPCSQVNPNMPSNLPGQLPSTVQHLGSLLNHPR